MTFPLLFSGGPGSPNGKDSNHSQDPQFTSQASLANTGKSENVSIFEQSQRLFNIVVEATKADARSHSEIDSKLIKEFTAFFAKVPHQVTLNPEAENLAAATQTIFDRANQVASNNPAEIQSVDKAGFSELTKHFNQERPHRSTPRNR